MEESKLTALGGCSTINCFPTLFRKLCGSLIVILHFI